MRSRDAVGKESEWSRNGVGRESEWSRNGVEMESKWSRKELGKNLEKSRNGVGKESSESQARVARLTVEPESNSSRTPVLFIYLFIIHRTNALVCVRHIFLVIGFCLHISPPISSVARFSLFCDVAAILPSAVIAEAR